MSNKIEAMVYKHKEKFKLTPELHKIFTLDGVTQCQCGWKAIEEVYNPNEFQDKAREIVKAHYNDQFSTPPKGPYLVDQKPLKLDEIYVVWFVKVLQNWKALVSTTRSDGQYFELTYNGDKEETYMDTYVKLENTKVSDEFYFSECLILSED